jgi:hypothetical protein
VERILGAGYQMHLTTRVNASAVVAAVASWRENRSAREVRRSMHDAIKSILVI